MDFQIDAAFPGGNILVERIENDTVFMRQDIRDTSEWWFYWHFRVRGASGCTLRFQFINGDVFAALGPCLSLDDQSWEWMGHESVQDNGFSFIFPGDSEEVYFAFCPPYRQSELNEFLSRQPPIDRKTLCTSEQGRGVEHLLVPSERGENFVLLTSRTHACESIANFVLEGVLEFWQSAPEAEALRENTDLHVVPFLDKDGVEKGDQGKLRTPHDHNRDFIETPLYVSTRALIEQAPQWRGRCALFLDLHCPWIRGGRNEEIFFLGLPPAMHPELERLIALLEKTQRGSLTFDARHTIMPGEEWYQADAPTAAHWARESLSPRLGTTLEVPYALAGEQIVTPENARAFGHDLGRALTLYLQL